MWLYDVKLWEYLTQELTWTKIIAIKVRSIQSYLRLQRAINRFKSSANYFRNDYVASMGKKIT